MVIIVIGVRATETTKTRPIHRVMLYTAETV